jgi:hypothetical protein
MAAPTTSYSWDTNGTNAIEPSSSQYSDGLNGTTYVADVWKNINYHLKSLGDWIGYLNGGNELTWTNVTYAGSWQNVGAYQPVSYTKTANGIVLVRGYCQSGSGTIFTLPSGHRPAADEMFSANGNGGAAVIKVTTAGVVSLNSGSGVSGLTVNFQLQAS